MRSVQPIKMPPKAEQQAMFDESEAQLLARVHTGQEAERGLAAIASVIDEIQANLFQAFITLQSSGDPGTDGYSFLVLHLKGKLLAEIKARLTAKATIGKEALEDLEEIKQSGGNHV